MVLIYFIRKWRLGGKKLRASLWDLILRYICAPMEIFSTRHLTSGFDRYHFIKNCPFDSVHAPDGAWYSGEKKSKLISI